MVAGLRPNKRKILWSGAGRRSPDIAKAAKKHPELRTFIMQHSSYDLVIVSGRRPELLERTLDSFNEKVFSNFAFDNVIVNVDPFGGSKDDGRRVNEIIKRFFPSSQILNQEKACFTSAVKRLWALSKSDVLFHLEDDWEALEKIIPEDIEDWIDETNKAVTLCNKNNFYDFKSKYRFQNRKKKYLLRKSRNYQFPVFTTSPCFLDGDFARKCAKLLDVRLDPEKQFYRKVNEELERFVSRFTNRNLLGEYGPYMIRDIGREWRKDRSIVKIVDENACSKWIVRS